MIDEQTKKICVYMYICVYTYIYECYSAIKKNEILPFVTTWMDLEGINAKWNKSDRERQILYDFTYIWNLKKQKNKHNKTETDSEI